ncbi:MAG: hypothetical protein HYY52_02340 [Candidatus Melainabacteria bacterium]|nr:hypothetical protein [Candidatus Melainabacteria bacterium]
MTNSKNYFDQIKNVLKSKPLMDEIGELVYTKTFHTLTFLNESGLIVISKLNNGTDLNLYMIIVAGENNPVDLINLLKLCKETRVSTKGSTV